MDFERPHRRLNPLTREWVLVSPHRDKRPWQGQVEKPSAEQLPAYDPDCYLCPGNLRHSGTRNPAYTGTFVFENDFPALLPPGGNADEESFEEGLLVARPEAGRCLVVCFSPRHDLSLPELDQPMVEAVVRTWIEQTRELGSLDYIHYVQIFENKGAMMGASNPHPHSQIWGTRGLPNEPAKELRSQAEYYSEYGRCLLCDAIGEEVRRGERLVVENEHFVALVPFWAVWPFELLVASRNHRSSLLDLTAPETSALASILRDVTARYDNLFEASFPYSMGFHQAPMDGVSHDEWHLHLHFYPPLLRSATVRKFMVGFEMLGMPQRDITPEKAAARLRALNGTHYKATRRSNEAR